MENRLTFKKVVLSYFVFVLIWSVRIVLLKIYIDSNFVFWTKEIINGFIKSVIWFGFALYLIKEHDKKLKISLKEMFTNKIQWKIFLPILIIFIAYNCIGMFSTFGGFQISPNFHPSQLISQFLLVGVLEEIVFRGWFYNALSTFIAERKANIIQALFFMGIHYPSYIIGGTFKFPGIILTSVFLFGMGIIFGWTFRKNKSLWTPIILHMVWDLLAISINGGL
jgi:membrane protease YdiL (CAAX protease family)